MCIVKMKAYMSIIHLFACILMELLFYSSDATDDNYFGEQHVTVEHVCQGHSFTPRCHSGSVVVMQRARYGRMEASDCVVGNLGCHADVLTVADALCSGRPDCEIRVSNPDMDRLLKLQGCNMQLIRSLEVAYTCVQAVNTETAKCSLSRQIRIMSTPQHISSVAVNASTCRELISPWKLSAQKGQHIQMRLIDMSWSNSSQIVPSDGCSVRYGYIIDDLTKERTPICGGRKDKIVDIGRSLHHKVSLYLEKSAIAAHLFMIGFRAVGCPDLMAPSGAWLLRDGDDITVGCNGTEHTWHLHCQGDRWHGVIGNCTQQTLLVQAQHSTDDEYKYSAYNGLVIFLVLSISVILSALIVFAGVLWFKRHYDYETPRHPKPNESESYQCFLDSNRSGGPQSSSHSYRIPCPSLPGDRNQGAMIYPAVLAKDSMFCHSGGVSVSDSMSVCQLHGAVA